MTQQSFFSVICPKNLETLLCKEMCIFVYIAALSAVAETQSQPNFFNQWLGKEDVKKVKGLRGKKTL